jgi:hypothetical protein
MTVLDKIRGKRLSAKKIHRIHDGVTRISHCIVSLLECIHRGRIQKTDTSSTHEKRQGQHGTTASSIRFLAPIVLLVLSATQTTRIEATARTTPEHDDSKKHGNGQNQSDRQSSSTALRR